MTCGRRSDGVSERRDYVFRPRASAILFPVKERAFIPVHAKGLLLH